MDGRVLIKGNQPGFQPSPIGELAGWKPGPARCSEGPLTKRIEPVSLIVPTFFNSELKRRSLRFLLAGLTVSQAVQEIIFVSSDGEKRGFDDLLTLVAGRKVCVVEADPHNRGKSRNAGAAVASSPLLLFLDDDMLVRNWRGIDWLVEHLIAADQECAMFPRRHYAKFPLLFDPPMLQKVIDHWREHADPAGEPFLFDPLAEGARDLPMLFCFPGCFMLIRRDAFLRLDGFKEDFIGWGFEDTEFALRAIRALRVMNLFRQGEPLLHIDHPVSPYKSDEHNANFRKFYAPGNRIDVNVFCRQVFLGQDFSPSRRNALSVKTAYTKPLRELKRRGVPLNLRTLRPWYLKLAQDRLAAFLSPLPQFSVIHGSRSIGNGSSPGGDFDVLCLFQGAVQNFFVSDDNPRVELECADMHRFENIAEHPALHTFQGPMELAKVAQARLLWGDKERWEQWSGALIEKALARGWCFWLVFGLGLRRHSMKYGVMVNRYFESLSRLRERGLGLERASLEFDFADEPALISAARQALCDEFPDWRERVAKGEGLFELQVPEVWIALQRLRETSRPRPARLTKARRAALLQQRL